jgi:DNA-binding transcriptional LysR family regulator
MDLLQLERFPAVADEGSFTRAAERVFRTQPAVRQSVKGLAKTVAAALFARDTPELPLTRRAARWSTMRDPS